VAVAVPEELPNAAPSATSAPDGMEGSEATAEAVGKEGEVSTAPNDRDEPRRSTETPEKRQPAKEVDRRKAATPKKASSAEDPSVGAKAKAPRASTSSGSVLSYASRARAKVSGHVPRSGAGRGTVVVSFGVTSSGGLSYARIARSSGNSAVDRAVLAGVRSAAPFPSPPAGATSSQLRFSVSFQFR
jgi:periplasmic protein TonB